MSADFEKTPLIFMPMTEYFKHHVTVKRATLAELLRTGDVEACREEFSEALAQ